MIAALRKGKTTMQKAKAATAVLLCCMLAQSAYAGERTQAAVRPVRVIRAALSQVREPAEMRGRIAVCANLAAISALDAKDKGAGFAVQDRILDLTFVLCMAGRPLQG
jgi:hypothetical protein